MKKKNEYIVQNLNIIKENNMLKGNQKKLDKNKDGKISGEDFKMLRKMELGGATDIAQAILGEAGKTISDADVAKVMKLTGASDKFLKDSANFESLSRDNMRKILQMLNRSGSMGDMSKERMEELLDKMRIINKPMKMKKGGEVEAKPKKRVAKKKTTMTSRGGGAALRGTKFVGVR